MSIKVIDLFSGPGGLGEGFSSVKDSTGNSVYEIIASIEKEESAHQTLLLRAFYRKLNEAGLEDYYRFLEGKMGKSPNDQLYASYPQEYKAAQEEAHCLTLGADNKKIYSAIRRKLNDDECVLIGGPPCQAYSLAGRSRNMGNENYDPKADHRNFLYLEYLKVIARFQPMFFVMENVKGMLSAKIDGKPIFDSIYKDLQAPQKFTGASKEKGRSERKEKYKIFSLVKPVDDQKHDPKDFVIKSEFYGVPQKRHRVILIGVREDIAHKWSTDNLLQINGKTTPTENVLSDLPKLRSSLSKGTDSQENWISAIAEAKTEIIPALKASKNKSHAFVADKMERAINAICIDSFITGQNLNILTSKLKTGRADLNSWYRPKNAPNVTGNHQARGHIKADLWRYLFCASWGQAGEENGWDTLTPKSKDYIPELEPNHANFNSGKFADRFRVQAAGIASTTVTSHISKDGHYFIHYDPTQCRSLTVREAARLQTFPDSYFFMGNRTQQYTQVGNAVPPYLAFKIAQAISKLLD